MSYSINNMNRKEKINTILFELKVLRDSTSDPDRFYAIDANIEFYKSIKSIFSYIYWLFRIAPKLDPKKLQEINDLLPEYTEEMHRHLVSIERKNFPGLIKDFVKRISDFVYLSNKDLIMMNIGSGGMELERQIIEKLIKTRSKSRIIFVGDDMSDLSHKVAKENLRNLSEKISYYSFEELNLNYIERIQKMDNSNYIIIQCKNNFSKLLNFFPENYFDLIYSSFFRHHLNSKEVDIVQSVGIKVSKSYFEYDGLRNLFQLIPQSLVAWSNVILLNGSVLSGLRYVEKNNLLKNINSVGSKNIDSKISYNKLSHYLLELSKK